MEKKEIEKPKYPIKKIKVKVIGIGNGGGSIVSGLSQVVKGTKFLVANTDKLALLKLPKKIETFHFGQNLTGGLGTGMDFQLAEMAAREEKERIKKILKGNDLCIFVSCLGGGVGSGACPVFAEISKKLGNINYGIFTLPFNFEGEKKLEIAKSALERLKPNLNAISVIPNERIFQIVDKKTPLKTALLKINQILAFSLEGLIELIYKPGLINIDFADLKTILAGSGSLAYLSKAEAEGKERAKKVLKNLLSSPLYPYGISKAKRALFNISGPKTLALSEIAQISQGIFSSIKSNSKIIFGVSQRKEEKIGISLLALGCQKRNSPKKKIKEKPKLKKKTPNLKKEKVQTSQERKKIRKNALQLQKVIAELEEEIRKKEEIWETPAFLRRNLKINP